MRAVYLDCFAGVSGNMLLGALIDAGLPENVLREELGKLSVHGYEIVVEKVLKCGIQATYVDVRLEEHHHSDDHGHHHGHQPHRHLPDIFGIIDSSPLDDAVKEKSKKVFLLLAEAEAKVHGTTADKIHFHEVGAVDAIVDIVGTVFGLHYLGIEVLFSSRLQTGFGFVKCSHGTMPVPAPATAELLKTIPHYAGSIEKELVTPTGAALIKALGTQFGDLPANFKADMIGYGAGSWDLEIPNALRLHVGEITPGDYADVLVAEANVDDLNPQVYSYVMDKLFAAGALDVWLTPVIMKKTRPATVLSVLINSDKLERIVAIIFAETSTIGLRYYKVQRYTASRNIIQTTTPWGEVDVKVSCFNGNICTATPEYEDCRRLAEASGVPLKTVQQAALAEVKIR
jgi:uncharacterized protein (TIGR00299 family) protein